VYDHLGMIDTLGYNCDETKYTKSFSEELGGWFAIKLPFGYAIQMIDYFEKGIKICKL
jgi:hypothetical protein